MKRFFVFIFLLIQIYAFSQTPIPELWGTRVHDEAHILSSEKIESLEQQLKTVEDSTSNQIAILIIPTLGNDVLEDYSLRVAEKWKLGKKDKDNGALLLIVVDDHKVRIETGQGLEGPLPDAICSRIIRNEIAPYFRQDEYDAGVQAGIDAMIKAIGGEYKTDDNNSDSVADLTIGEKLLLGAFIFGILGVFTFFGLFTPGCGGWFLYIFLIPFYAIFPLVVIGTTGGLSLLIVYVIMFPIFKIIASKLPWGKRMGDKLKNSRGGSGGGWSSGGGFFGGGGGWSSGGGFSGGGGSFGGGGSSGSW